MSAGSEQKSSNETAGSKSRDPLVGTTLDGRYLIEESIGSGGMSVVYRATQIAVNRHVAIKTLRVQLDTKPVYRERFQREIALLCALNHPNIVTVYDCVIGPDDQPYVVMDYLRGQNLEQLIARDGVFSVDRFARIAIQVCSALDYAHRKGVIHRDLKPGNIVMLDDEMDFVKVVDFGLAKLNADNRKLTQSGELWGSPPYMSPEQCKGKPEDERSDIYSVGAVMYEMLTGKDPFHYANTVFELIQTHISAQPAPLVQTNPLANIPPELEQVVFKCMAKEAVDRYQNAAELRDALIDACAMTSGRSGELAMLGGQGRIKSASGGSQITSEQRERSVTPFEMFNRALDPMDGFSPSDMLHSGQSGQGAQSFGQPGGETYAQASGSSAQPFADNSLDYNAQFNDTTSDINRAPIARAQENVAPQAALGAQLAQVSDGSQQSGIRHENVAHKFANVAHEKHRPDNKLRGVEQMQGGANHWKTAVIVLAVLGALVAAKLMWAPHTVTGVETRTHTDSPTTPGDHAPNGNASSSVKSDNGTQNTNATTTPSDGSSTISGENATKSVKPASTIQSAAATKTAVPSHAAAPHITRPKPTPVKRTAIVPHAKAQAPKPKPASHPAASKNPWAVLDGLRNSK